MSDLGKKKANEINLGGRSANKVTPNVHNGCFQVDCSEEYTDYQYIKS